MLHVQPLLYGEQTINWLKGVQNRVICPECYIKHKYQFVILDENLFLLPLTISFLPVSEFYHCFARVREGSFPLCFTSIQLLRFLAEQKQVTSQIPMCNACFLTGSLSDLQHVLDILYTFCTLKIAGPKFLKLFSRKCCSANFNFMLNCANRSKFQLKQPQV